MGFIADAVFPDDLSYSSRGGPGFSNSVVETAAGELFGVARWSAPKHRYDARYAVKSHSDLNAIKEHYIAVQGILNTFPFKDWSDYATTPTRTLHNPGDATVTENDVTIGTGDGSTTQFQLKTQYSYGSTVRDRTIKLPKSGTVKIAFDGVDQASGWTVNTSTGVVTFSVAPSAAVVITAGFEFDVPVKYDVAADELFDAQIDAYDVESIPSIPLVETNNDVASSEEVPLGGGEVVTLTADTEYSYSHGRMVVLSPQIAGLKYVLPPIDDLELGPMHFFISNAGTDTVDIHETLAGASLLTLAVSGASGDWCMAGVYDDAGTKKWRLFG